MDEIPHLDVDVTRDNYQNEFLIVLKKIRPDWKEDEVVFKESPKDVALGLINTMVRCHGNQHPEDSIMIRILNKCMDEYRNRSDEVNCIKYLYKHHGCAPNILATFRTGFCYEYIHGEVLNCLRLREEPIWRCLAEELAKINSANVNEIHGFSKEDQFKILCDKIIANYPESLQDTKKNKIFKENFPDKETLKKEMDEVWAHAMLFNHDLVLTHGDTRGENIVWNAKAGIAKIMDYELIGYSYRGCELAAHFERFGGFGPTNYSLIPDEEFRLRWLRVYLEKYYQETGRNASDVTDTDVRRLHVKTRKMELIYLLMMGSSGPMFDEMNVVPADKMDVLGDSVVTMKEYYKQKEAILALQMPE